MRSSTVTCDRCHKVCDSTKSHDIRSLFLSETNYGGGIYENFGDYCSKCHSLIRDSIRKLVISL